MYGRHVSSAEPGDADLMREVATGSREALALLHRRFAGVVLRVAAQSLDRAAAEDVVQDVFLSVWRHAASFDPGRGSLHAWIFQITHFRVLNELRRRRRQPPIEPDVDGVLLGALPAQDPDLADGVAAERRRAMLRAAVDGLPPTQRAALDLAFFADLTHAQVAAALDLPLGTTKSRIRAGLETLRGKLGPQWAALVAGGVLIALGVRYGREHAVLDRYDRALSMVTASDSTNLRMAAGPGMPADTHARYRGRPGAGIAVVTLSKFPPSAAGTTYQAWARYGRIWVSLGTAEIDGAGSARLIAENDLLATSPEAVKVTVEPRGGSAGPSGPIVVSWTP